MKQARSLTELADRPNLPDFTLVVYTFKSIIAAAAAAAARICIKLRGLVVLPKWRMNAISLLLFRLTF